MYGKRDVGSDPADRYAHADDETIRRLSEELAARRPEPPPGPEKVIELEAEAIDITDGAGQETVS